VAAAAAQAQTLYDTAAAAASLTGAAVNLKPGLVTARLVPSVAVIPKRRTSSGDARNQDVNHRLAQTLDFRPRQVFSPAHRQDAGGLERFIGVDIT
jgi:hypothetical protein